MATKAVTQFELPPEVLHKPAEKVLKKPEPGIVAYSLTTSSVKASLVKKVFDEQ